MSGRHVQPPPYSAEAVSDLIGQTPIGEGNARGMRMNEIQQKIGRGEYEVDTHAVADAILRRLLQRQETASSADSHNRGD
jgi:anti-sigma28 factor (negative regulator of flagellin synthesis)